MPHTFPYTAVIIETLGRAAFQFVKHETILSCLVWATWEITSGRQVFCNLILLPSHAPQSPLVAPRTWGTRRIHRHFHSIGESLRRLWIKHDNKSPLTRNTIFAVTREVNTVTQILSSPLPIPTPPPPLPQQQQQQQQQQQHHHHHIITITTTTLSPPPPPPPPPPHYHHHHHHHHHHPFKQQCN